jgi:radical SAM superfamily enzyme YgiQ (UPF0313 family)
MVDLDLEIRHSSKPESRGGLDPFLGYVEDFEPTVVAITSMYSNSLQASRMIKAAKHSRTDIITVAGGSHFGAMGDVSLQRIPELDFVIEGEGERSLVSLLHAIEVGGPWSDVPSLWYRAGDRNLRNAPHALLDLSELPNIWAMLAGTVTLSRYIDTNSANAPFRMMYTEAGRGCPFACAFCATAPFWRRRYRVRPVGHIVNEMQFLHEGFGYNRFILLHDLLTVNAQFVSEFCDAMISARLPVEWMANSRTDIRLDGLLPKMKAAGCWSLFMGVESGSDRLQRKIDKHLDLRKASETVVDLAQNGISATCSFVIGFPDESAAEVGSSIALGAHLKLIGVEFVQFHRLRSWPPAPLAAQDLDAEFDLDSLKIEYPFLEVPEEDANLIRGDRTFFGGYFVPLSSAGSPHQLAQAEMFFHHAVALAPLTVAAIGRLWSDRLMECFCATLADLGPIEREMLDWEEGNFWGNWLAVQPYMEGLLRRLPMDRVSVRVISELVTYERNRLEFISGVWRMSQSPLVKAAKWAAYACRIDLPGTIDALRRGIKLNKSLLSTGGVVLAQRRRQSFAALALDAPSFRKLVDGEARLRRKIGEMCRG